MKKVTYETLKKPVMLVGIILVLVIAFTAAWTWLRYVMVNGNLYPKEPQLDLRDRVLTVEEYDKLAEKLPESEILWNVPMSSGSRASDAQRLEITELTDQDVELLQYFSDLQVLDGRACGAAAQLAAARQKYPDCQVLYTVTIGGVDYSQDAQQVTASGLKAEEVPLLESLLDLSSLEVSGCEDYALLRSLKETYPQWNVSYTVGLGGEEFAWDATEVVAYSVGEEELVNGMKGLVNLQSITLHNPKAGAECLMNLRDVYPDTDIRWELTLEGQTYADDLTEVDISHMPIESVEQAKTIGSYFPQLEKLIVDSGSVDNDTMAQFRESMRPDYKVVWTVVCGTGKYGSFEVRTDETTFMPLKHGIYYFHDDDMYNVRYCEDMVCMDVGHMTFTDVSFVEYMPHLKYLILNFTSVKDITPLSSCKELVFLELDHSWVTDYSPLLGCTALEDLNLGDTYGDPEPIAQMTWLKNLWWVSRSMSVKTYLEQTLTDTYLLFRPNTKQTTSFGWRKLPNYYAMRDMLEMPYMD